MADKDVALGNCSVSFQLSFILPYGTVYLRTSVLQSTWLNLNASFVHTHSVLFTLCKLLVCLSASCLLFCCLMLQVFVVCTGRSCLLRFCWFQPCILYFAVNVRDFFPSTLN